VICAIAESGGIRKRKMIGLVIVQVTPKTNPSTLPIILEILDSNTGKIFWVAMVKIISFGARDVKECQEISA